MSDERRDSKQDSDGDPVKTDQEWDERAPPGIIPGNALLIIPSMAAGSGNPPRSGSVFQKSQTGLLDSETQDPEKRGPESAKLISLSMKVAPSAGYRRGYKIQYIAGAQADDGIPATQNPSIAGGRKSV